VTRRLKQKFTQFLKKKPKTFAEPKPAKISALKYILKVKNINNKTLIKSIKTCNKLCFETAYLSNFPEK
jgi:hypothetical protein